MRASGVALLSALVLGGCGPDTTHVAGPFYLTYIENPREMALFRCPNGPDDGCAGDGLPDATVFAAGSDEKYVVLVRHPYKDGDFDRKRSEYFYFARVKAEFGGWGNNPEKIIGPLDQDEFFKAKRQHNLPDFSIRLSDLE